MENKIFGFDYAKIIAASFLVFHHYQQVFGCQFSDINFYGGKIGFGLLVELFFTISGFLTLYSEQRQMSARGGRGFFIRYQEFIRWYLFPYYFVYY